MSHSELTRNFDRFLSKPNLALELKLNHGYYHPRCIAMNIDIDKHEGCSSNCITIAGLVGSSTSNSRYYGLCARHWRQLCERKGWYYKLSRTVCEAIEHDYDIEDEGPDIEGTHREMREYIESNDNEGFLQSICVTLGIPHNKHAPNLDPWRKTANNFHKSLYTDDLNKASEFKRTGECLDEYEEDSFVVDEVGEDCGYDNSDLSSDESGDDGEKADEEFRSYSSADEDEPKIQPIRTKIHRIDLTNDDTSVSRGSSKNLKRKREEDNEEPISRRIRPRGH